MKEFRVIHYRGDWAVDAAGEIRLGFGSEENAVSYAIERARAAWAEGADAAAREYLPGERRTLWVPSPYEDVAQAE